MQLERILGQVFGLKLSFSEDDRSKFNSKLQWLDGFDSTKGKSTML